MFLLVAVVPRQSQHRIDQALPRVNVTRGHYVFQHGHAGKQTDILKSPRDTAPRNLIRPQLDDALPFEMNLAGSRLVNAGQQIENRCLARAVRSDEAVDLAALDLHVQFVDGDQAAEAKDRKSNV